jgi:dihydrofolate reductase
MLQGGLEIVSTFIQLALIDEYRIGVVAIILGEGKSLLKAIKDTPDLQPTNREIAKSV